MKIHVFPPSGRVVGVVALKNYLALDCELKPIDLGRGDQRAPEYVALNPNSAAALCIISATFSLVFNILSYLSR
jgi:hypothetical protein